ncbi:MAG: hypothetical protein WC301_04785 [Candidatus Omnitrophota bacterium]
MSIVIVKTFVKLREIMSAHKHIAFKLRELEERIEGHDTDIRDIFEAIRQLVGIPHERRKIRGFTVR